MLKVKFARYRLLQKAGLGRIAISLVLFCPSIALLGQTAPVQNGILSELERLAKAQQWDDLARRVEASPEHSPAIDFYYGSALAHLGRFAQADGVLRDGQRV